MTINNKYIKKAMNISALMDMFETNYKNLEEAKEEDIKSCIDVNGTDLKVLNFNNQDYNKLIGELRNLKKKFPLLGMFNYKKGINWRTLGITNGVVLLGQVSFSNYVYCEKNIIFESRKIRFTVDKNKNNLNNNKLLNFTMNDEQRKELIKEATKKFNKEVTIEADSTNKIYTANFELKESKEYLNNKSISEQEYRAILVKNQEKYLSFLSKLIVVFLETSIKLSLEGNDNQDLVRINNILRS